MRSLGDAADEHLNVIVDTTLIKGYCHAGYLRTPKALMEDMVGDRIKPDGFSLNCLLIACFHAGAGNVREAWATIDRMQASGLKVDQHTISIMMKAIKRVNNPKNVVRVLSQCSQDGVGASHSHCARRFGFEVHAIGKSEHPTGCLVHSRRQHA